MKKTTAESGSAGAVYWLGVIGAMVWFLSHATGFWNGVVGFFKALVWPAILVYYSLDKLLGA